MNAIEGLAERNRLRALNSHEILDTEAEPEFDRLTRLASLSLDVPMALVSLLDSERQWFKSKVGLDVSQTPREWAFCQYTIRQDAPLIVNDARQDSRFADNPLVVGEPHVRFYAGVPLRDEDGFAMGTLCIIDTKAREFSNQEREVLQLLAEQVRQLLANRRRKLQAAAHDFAREQELTKLRDAMRHVSWLSGLLKICSNCRQIKNREGKWQSLEAFIQNNSDASFSHSICRECRDELYPELRHATE